MNITCEAHLTVTNYNCHCSSDATVFVIAKYKRDTDQQGLANAALCIHHYNDSLKYNPNLLNFYKLFTKEKYMKLIITL